MRLLQTGQGVSGRKRHPRRRTRHRQERSGEARFQRIERRRHAADLGRLPSCTRIQQKQAERGAGSSIAHRPYRQQGRHIASKEVTIRDPAFRNKTTTQA